MRKAFTWWDGLLAGGLLAANAAVLLSPRDPVGTVEILSDGGAQTFDLRESGRVQVPGPLGLTVVEFGQSGARVASSPCPNQLCVRSGIAARANQVIACLPNRVAVQILGSRDARSPDGVDAVAR